MRIYVNAAVNSRWLKEFEVKRSDLSPLMFWRLVKKAMEDHGEDLTDWIASFDEWIKPYQPTAYHETNFGDFREALGSRPYDFHIYRSDSYNVILEFNFYNMRKGNGYFYFASNQ